MCRETGMMAELSDVPVHSLVPEALRGIASADEFMAALPQYDDQMAQQLDEATAAGDCLRFVGESLWLPAWMKGVGSHLQAAQNMWAREGHIAKTSQAHISCAACWVAWQYRGPKRSDAIGFEYARKMILHVFGMTARPLEEEHCHMASIVSGQETQTHAARFLTSGLLCV